MGEPASNGPVRASASVVFGACATEAELVSARFARLEQILLLVVEQSRVAHEDPLLQEALQDMDMIAQHIETLRVVLCGAAESGNEAGLVDIEGTIRAVRLEVVAGRLAQAMSLREHPAEVSVSGEMELL